MQNTRRKAFTLIELLVVIAIIAILAAILFPVFAQAKAAAKKTAAVSNLKQNALAVLMYNDSNDGVFPQSIYLEVNGTTKNLVSAFDAIYPFTKNKEIYEDPGEPKAIDWKDIITTKVPGGPYTSPQNILSAGVAFNFALFENPTFPSPVNADPVVAEGAISNPVGTTMFYTAGYTLNGVKNKYLTQFPRPPFTGDVKYTQPTGVFSRHNFAGAPRHSGQLVVNYVDGHAAAIRGNGKLVGQGVDKNTTSTALIDCYNLPYDLNGIPDFVGEPKE